jgi:hypothetical protein
MPLSRGWLGVHRRTASSTGASPDGLIYSFMAEPDEFLRIPVQVHRSAV